MTALPTFRIFREFYKTVSQDDDAQDDEPNGFYAGKFVFGFLVENTTKYLNKGWIETSAKLYSHFHRNFFAREFSRTLAKSANQFDPTSIRLNLAESESGELHFC